jgi:hypothetical protein
MFLQLLQLCSTEKQNKTKNPRVSLCCPGWSGLLGSSDPALASEVLGLQAYATGIIFFILLFTCAYIVWVISPPCPPPLPSPPFPPQFQAGPVLPLSLVLLKKRDMPNKEDKVFLLVELRIAIQKYS